MNVRRQTSIDASLLEAADRYCQGRTTYSLFVESLVRAELKRRDALPAQETPPEVKNEGHQGPDTIYDLGLSLDGLQHEIDNFQDRLLELANDRKTKPGDNSGAYPG